MTAQMLPQEVVGLILKINALAYAVSSGLKNVSKTWIVDVRDLNTQHVCTGSLVSAEYVLAACSCVLRINPTTKQKEKQQRKVFFSFEGK